MNVMKAGQLQFAPVSGGCSDLWIAVSGMRGEEDSYWKLAPDQTHDRAGILIRIPAFSRAYHFFCSVTAEIASLHFDCIWKSVKNCITVLGLVQKVVRKMLRIVPCRGVFHCSRKGLFRNEGRFRL